MLDAKYDHKEIEKGRYENWLEHSYFSTHDKKKEPFCIVLPPPNVTGMLHIGHALNLTLQDVICRYKRMQGYDVCWVAGMDHAGIATQAKVEKRLRDLNINKYEIGREKFLEYAWDWKKEYAETIRKQWAKMGVSLDYSKEAFTLDEKRNIAVRKVFTSLYEKGYIYRKEKIINWDPVLKTALSNIEVIYKEDKGCMYYFKYFLENSNEYIVVGTTRPETMFGDVAVVCNPKDERYKKLKGKKLINPANGVLLQVIFDPYVDIEFGTGAMKCTPAHDPNDYNLGIKYNLDFIICINKDATMNERAGKYVNQDRYECRENLINDLKEKGLVDHIDEITHQVGHSERSDAVIEPMLSKQWFVAMKKLSENAVNLQKSEEGVDFFPPRFEDTYLQWLSNIDDWCISRQLWWGHRIPAYYHKETGEVLVSFDTPKDMENYVQDEDVLDTWFSSALWPFTTLGWPENTDDFKRYYPNSLLVTAYDIIFFWVSRMMFQAVEFTNKMPFNQVLIHGLIRDELGRKMSKSLGNGVDPIEVIDKYGADALRLFLSTNSAPGLDFRFSTIKIESSWNFLNKVYNASKFVLLNLPNDFKEEPINYFELSLADKWILSRLNNTIVKVSENLDKYEFANVGTYLTSFVYDDYCSWYIELSKLTLLDDSKAKATRNVLHYVLKQILIMIHPFAPFISEKIYLELKGIKESINLESWPLVIKEYNNEEVIDAMNRIIEIITQIRTLRNLEGIANATPLELIIKDNSNGKLTNAINNNMVYMNKFTNASKISFVDKEVNLTNVRVIAIADGILYVNLANAIDVSKEIEKVELELKKVQAGVARGEGMLHNPEFMAKAPQFKIDVEKKNLDDYYARQKTLLSRLDELKKMKK